MKPDLRQKIKDTILTGDGAMGTYLYQMGFPVGISYEEFNLTRPDIVKEVHRKYYEAGARIIETNTFSATREKLSRYGLGHDVETINRAGVRIAREAVGKDAYVIGAVGAIRGGRKKLFGRKELESEFREQIEALLMEDPDGIILETFFDLDEILIPLRIIRKLSDIPVICQFAVEDSGSTIDAVSIEQAVRLLIDEGGDIAGLNCRSGPNGMLRTLENMQSLNDVSFSVFPNAGTPDYVDGEYKYMASPEYFATSAKRFADLGARIIGGCCGTTPEHVKAIAEALQNYEPKERQQAASSETEETVVKIRAEIKERPGKEVKVETILDLVKQRHTVIVELDPPRDLNIDKFMEGAAALQRAGVDAITLADNSLAVTRMSNMALGYLVKDRLGARPLVHIACRDRNLLGTQSHLMGLDALGMNHVLAVTGDPTRFGDLPGSSSVYDTNSFEMIRMIKQLNNGISFSGRPLKQMSNFVVGAAFNPNVKFLDKAVKRLEKKVEAGADYIMTQPVYDPELIRKIAEAVKHIPIPIFIGIMPLASERNAEFLHNEVPGIELSDEVLKRMKGLSGEEGRKEGVAIAKELLDEAMKHFNGIYLMTPFMFYEMTETLTKYIWEKTKHRHNPHLYPLSK